MKRVFVITTDDDGHVSVEHLLKEEVLKRLREDHYGHRPLMLGIPDKDAHCWGPGILVIEGVINPPKPKKVVEEYSFEE
jgi:hypothetical protein